VEDEPELIRDQMQETRTALTEKIDALEQKVTSTVQDTTAAVAETVETVKDTVQATVDTVKDTVASTVDTVSGTVEKTVETVKDTFDIPARVREHPYVAVFGSLAAGFVLGKLIHPGRENRGGTSTKGQSWPEAIKQSAPEPAPAAASPPPRREEKKSTWGAHEGIMGGLLNAFGGEVDKLKSLGIAALFGVVRDLVGQSVQGEMGSRLKEWFNSLTEKMGARPFTEPVLEPTEQEDKAGEDRSSQPEQQQQQQHSQPAKGAPAQKGHFETGSPQRR
jgi:ElaB/YqjD/DUF883 family membrane-anchored ribosome-binding protein